MKLITSNDCHTMDSLIQDLPSGSFIHIEDNVVIMCNRDVKDLTNLLNSYGNALVIVNMPQHYATK